MKRVFFLLGFLSFYMAKAQWPAYYNGTANADDMGRLICTDAAGNVYVSGTSQSKKTSGVSNFYDYVTIKYNSSGAPQWVARYNGTGNGDDIPVAIAVDGNGKVFVTGRSMGSGSYFDYATVAYNSSGVEQWSQRHNGITNKADWAKDVKVDGSGNVFVTGHTDAAPETISGFNGNKMTTIKYSPEGELLWTVVEDMVPDLYDGSGIIREEGNSLAVDAGNNVYVTGSRGGTAVRQLLVKYIDNGSSVIKQWEVIGNASSGRQVSVNANQDILLAGYTSLSKYNSSGELIWHVDGFPFSFRDIDFDNTGNALITGFTSTNDVNGSNYNTIKINPDGSQAWLRIFNGPANGNDQAWGVAADGNGNVYVTGQAIVGSGKNTQSKFGTVKYDALGNQIWVQLSDGPEGKGGLAYGIAAGSNNSIFVAGEINTKTSSKNFMTIHFPQPVTRVRNDDTFILTNHPNPFKSSTRINYELLQDTKVSLSVFDVNGRLVQVLFEGTQARGKHYFHLNRDLLVGGTYFIQLRTSDKNVTKKIIILE